MNTYSFLDIVTLFKRYVTTLEGHVLMCPACHSLSEKENFSYLQVHNTHTITCEECGTVFTLSSAQLQIFNIIE